MNPFSIHMLGCGSAMPTRSHVPSCQVVEYGPRLFMVDCGEGSHIQLERSPLRKSRLSHIFISHLHADHCLGLFGIFSAMRHTGRQEPLHVYAHPALEPLMRQNMAFFCCSALFEVVFHAIDAEKAATIYEDEGMQVSTVPLHHGVACAGYMFKEKTEPRRSYAYLSDTAYSPMTPPLVRGVSLLYHEATFANDMAGRAQAYGHSTTLDAARTALEAQAGRLIIGHFSRRYPDEQPLLQEARSLFPGTDLAREGKTFSIP